MDTLIQRHVEDVRCTLMVSMPVPVRRATLRLAEPGSIGSCEKSKIPVCYLQMLRAEDVSRPAVEMLKHMSPTPMFLNRGLNLRRPAISMLPHSDPDVVIDADDSTDFYREVNEDLEMRENARDLLEEEEEETGDQPMADPDSPDMVALVDSLQL